MAGIRTVLIIDSNKEDRAKVAVFLEEYYNVMEAASIGEAYRILDSNAGRVAAVILDITPDMQCGEELLRFMKRNEYLSRIPVIMTADTENEETEISALSTGASDFLYKPYSPVIVKKRLDNIISLSENASLASDCSGNMQAITYWYIWQGFLNILLAKMSYVAGWRQTTLCFS